MKAHDDLLDSYEEKLVDYGVSKEELGHKAIRFVPEDQITYSKSPAGLITENR